MIRKVADQRFKDDGQGLTLHHMLEKGEMYGGTLCARIQLAPGAGIGHHRHEGELEIYIVTKGVCQVQDDDQVADAYPGDVLLTAHTHSHSIYNRTQEAAEFLAIILQAN